MLSMGGVNKMQDCHMHHHVTNIQPAWCFTITEPIAAMQSVTVVLHPGVLCNALLWHVMLCCIDVNHIMLCCATMLAGPSLV